MDRDDMLRQVKSRLQEAFGERLRGVVLYGSEARGTAEPDSDIDLLVLLTGPLPFGNDLRTCVDVLYPLVLELDRPIHATPTDVAEYDAQDFLLYREARQEGIVA